MGYLNKNKKITLVMVTHDFGAIINKVNRIMCVSEGKIFEADKSKGFSNQLYGGH
jgi:zinc transport system ATP-binding protein